MNLGRHAVAGVVAGMAAIATCASVDAGVLFEVNIRLTPSAHVCVSENLSAETHALVRVVCGRDEFVDIRPQPGHPFTGVHGAAFRFHFSGGGLAEENVSTSDYFAGGGTITTWRTLFADAERQRLELLVSF